MSRFVQTPVEWREIAAPATVVSSLAKALGCSPLLARILIQRDPLLENPKNARRYLEPKLAHLNCPFSIKGMRDAVARLRRAIREKEQVLVFGDYDVDGITSTAALVHFLRQFKLVAGYVVPRRMEEGYGLTEEAVSRALRENGLPNLFIALDCGTNAVETISGLRARGVEVLVVDHHQELESGRADCLMVNPHLDHAGEEPAPPWLNLSTAGLVFKVVHGVVKAGREEGDPISNRIRVADYLDLAGMGTVADLVELSGENRLIARHGLVRLAKTRRPGVHALFHAAGIDLGEALESADISFKIGPRINAVGRLDDACIPVELLLGEDFSHCQRLADNLDALNQERKTIEAGIFEEAEAQIEGSGQARLPGIVVADPEWHPGVVGIVASRLCHAYHRPCLVLGAAEKEGEPGDYLKGSGRSVPGINLVRLLENCQPHLERWGGHPMAVGLSLRMDRADALREGFVEAIRWLHPEGIPGRILEIADWVRPEQVSGALIEELDRLRPFGQGNPRPLLGIRPVILQTPPQRLKGSHFRFQISNGNGGPLGGIAWNQADRIPPIGKSLDLAVRLSWNTWRGKRSLQLELVDWRIRAKSK